MCFCVRVGDRPPVRCVAIVAAHDAIAELEDIVGNVGAVFLFCCNTQKFDCVCIVLRHCLSVSCFLACGEQSNIARGVLVSHRHVYLVQPRLLLVNLHRLF